MRTIEDLVYLTKFTLDRSVELTDAHNSAGWQRIREGYKSEDATTRNIAAILNGLLSTSRIYFLLSKNEVSHQGSIDRYLLPKRKSISGKEFDKLKAILIHGKMIKVHADSSPFESNDRKAARVELILEPFRTEIVSSLNDDEFALHKEAFMKMVHLGNKA